MGSLSFPSIFFLLISSAFLFLLFLCPFYGSFYVLADGFFGGGGIWSWFLVVFFSLPFSFFLFAVVAMETLEDAPPERRATRPALAAIDGYLLLLFSFFSLFSFSFFFLVSFAFLLLVFFFCRRIIFFCWLCVSFFSSNRICTSFRLFESFFLRGGGWIPSGFTGFYLVSLRFD